MGRDATNDLVDCSSLHKTGKWNDTKLEDIAQNLAQPFGIQVLIFKGGINALAKDRRHLFLAFLKGPKAEINFANVLKNRLTITGSTLRPQSDIIKADIVKNLHQRVWSLLDSAKIFPIIHTFSLLNKQPLAIV